MAERYQGIRPLLQAASQEHGVDWQPAESNTSIQRLNEALCNADYHLRNGDIAASKATLDASIVHVKALRLAADAAQAAHDSMGPKIADAERAKAEEIARIEAESSARDQEFPVGDPDQNQEIPGSDFSDEPAPIAEPEGWSHDTPEPPDQEIPGSGTDEGSTDEGFPGEPDDDGKPKRGRRR